VRELSIPWEGVRLSKRAALRKLISREGTTLVPGVTDPFTARLAEGCGAEVLFSTGSGIANKWLGLPDLGLATLTEVVAANRRIAGATDLPVLADADDGFGGPLNAVRTVRELEAAGVAGIVLEDQTAPKRCGRFAGKEVVPVEAMLTKIRAVLRARIDDELVLVARTDALGVAGLDEAVARARAYAAAGADVVFVEAGSSAEQLAGIPAAVSVPCMVNVPEQDSLGLTRERLTSCGFKLALHANLALHAAAVSVRDAFRALLDTGTADGLHDRLLNWDDRQALAALGEWERFEEPS
jgi:2-methylisocitrate lyase-like PEP mutase family enzyme